MTIDPLNYCSPDAGYPGAKYPEWITILGVKGKNGRINIMPAGWGIELSSDPPLLGVSVGLSRYSHALLKDARYFSWSVPTVGMGPDVYFCGTNTGGHLDKTKSLTAMKIRPGRVSGAPLIDTARRTAECELVGEILTGDHRLFVGRVLNEELHPERPRLLNFSRRIYAAVLPNPNTIYKSDPQVRIDPHDPRWITLIVVHDAQQGRAEIQPISSFTITSHDPPMVAVALPRKSHAATLMNRSGHFTFNWPAAGWVRTLIAAGIWTDSRSTS